MQIFHRLYSWVRLPLRLDICINTLSVAHRSRLLSQKPDNDFTLSKENIHQPAVEGLVISFNSSLPWSLRSCHINIYVKNILDVSVLRLRIHIVEFTWTIQNLLPLRIEVVRLLLYDRALRLDNNIILGVKFQRYLLCLLHTKCSKLKSVSFWRIWNFTCALFISVFTIFLLQNK